MAWSRRELIRNGTIGAGVIAVGNVPMLLKGPGAQAAGRTGRPGQGYGPLIPDPAGVLDLPHGFSYSIVSVAGETLPNGAALPDRFDGTGAFAGPLRSVLLVRNHEQSGLGEALPTGPAAAASVVYDPGVTGGTSTVVIDRHGRKVDEYVSLAGTSTNCAGGETPWGTWLTCEETESKKGGALTKDHGFVFEVDPRDPTRNEVPTPLVALGRFAHEAVAIDPRTGDVYLTEDASNPNGLVYKCVPSDPGQRYGALRAGGTLYAMRCSTSGAFVPDLAGFTEPGTELEVDWVAVPDPLAASTSTRKQFRYSANPGGAPVTRSRKFEGMWWHDGKAFIVCSYARLSDGSVGEHDGQVWSHDPAAGTLTLEVRFDVNPAPSGEGADLPDGPDNITISPWGGMILCEDGEGVQHLLTVAPDGSTTLFARNHANDSEFAGACFSPDRKTLYVSVQSPGMTFAISGPFARIARDR